jgi:hypothetical protein
MDIIASIWNLLKRGNTPSGSGNNLQRKPTEPDDKGNTANTDKSMESEPGLEFLDGMSTGTARFIIDREVDPGVLEKYNIKELENKGRYYLAKIVNQDGEVAETVLIDKLNRSIHFQKAKLK